MQERLQAPREIVGVAVGRTPRIFQLVGDGNRRNVWFGDLLVVVGTGLGTASASSNPMERRCNVRDIII